MKATCEADAVSQTLMYVRSMFLKGRSGGKKAERPNKRLLVFLVRDVGTATKEWI